MNIAVQKIRPTRITFVRNDELLEMARKSSFAKAKREEAAETLRILKKPLEYY